MLFSVLRRHWWVAPAALVLLLLKAWFLSGVVQDRAQALAADAASVPEAQVEMVNGLDVNLVGFPDRASLDRAVAAVDELESSWVVSGELAPGADGGERVAGPAAVPLPSGSDPTETTVAPGTSTPAATVESGPTETVPASVGLEFTLGPLSLSGAANQDLRDRLVSAAEQRLGADLVEDRLVVDDRVVPTGGTLVVTGAASSESQRQAWAADAEAVAGAVGLTLDDRLTVATVAESLNELFALSPIEFDPSRATIRDASIPILREAARIIRLNPDSGRLRVVGHTDSDGTESENLTLSRRRAAAVVEFLVDEEGLDDRRLEAEGRGESEPKVSPERTAEDKQRNRRIEWELVG